MSTSVVIGEGAYGCIHKPSLTCKEPKIQSYKNKVSKVLKKKMAAQEIGEYAIIAKADKTHEYYLGNPIDCSVANTPTNIEAIQKCKTGKELLKNLDDLSLLVMEDGGINLKDYADAMGKWPATQKYIEKMENILLEFHRILRGIGVFLENDILHFDMKPQNIVYSDVNNRMNIIDFGLTVSFKDIMKRAKTNTNRMAMYHWSYPFEFHFLNKYTYEQFAKLSTKDKEEYYKSIIQGINKNDDEAATKAITGFYSFIFDNNIGSADFKQYMTGFYQTLLSEITPNNFQTFAKTSMHSVDVYGTGIALLYLLKKTHHLLPEKLHKDLYELGKNMVSAQLSKRDTAEGVLMNYETILTEHGIMKKHNVYFTNHKIEKGELLPKHIEQSIESIKMEDIILNENALAKNAVTADITGIKKNPPRKTRKPRKNNPASATLSKTSKSLTKKNKRTKNVL